MFQKIKKNVKWIIAIIVGIVIASGISVYATSTYLASDVSYKSINVATALNDLYSVAQTRTENNYSTEEQVIGTWIDGKPLYRKVININADGTKGVKVYTINIANVEYITVDETHSFLYATTPEYIPIKNIWDTANTGGYTILPNASNVKFQWYRKEWQHLPATITFEYTKTTD